MKEHIVAIFNHNDKTNKIHIVTTNTEVEAVKKSLIENQDKSHRTQNYIDWVENIGNTVEEVVGSAKEGGLVISNVVSIQS